MGQQASGADDLRARLRAHGLPYTIQRNTIYEVLSGRADHPTADALFEAVRGTLPGVSRTTVYRTLETFVEAGLCTRVSHPGSSARYDPKTHRHHHLVCDDCGAVIDLEPEEIRGGGRLRLAEASLEQNGMEVRDYSVQFTGRCADCA